MVFICTCLWVGLVYSDNHQSLTINVIKVGVDCTSIVFHKGWCCVCTRCAQRGQSHHADYRGIPALIGLSIAQVVPYNKTIHRFSYVPNDLKLNQRLRLSPKPVSDLSFECFQVKRSNREQGTRHMT